MGAETQIVPQQMVTPMHLLQLALEKESNIDVIERIATLQREERDYQQTIDFNEALNRCQAKTKRIAADLTNPQTHSKYASYAALDRVLRPIYSEEGFSLSFSEDAASTPDFIVMLGYLSRGGCTRVYRKTMPVDAKGPKGNDVMTKTHASGAADSYAKRYLLKDIFNVAVGEDDDDGNGETPEHAKIVAESLAVIAAAPTLEALQSSFTSAFGVAEQQRDKEAMALYTEARDKRRAELEAPEDELWAKQLAANANLEDFNKYVTPVAASRSAKHQQMATAAARERGWKFNRAMKAYEVAA